MKAKHIKLPFKFKYIKQDVIFEVSSCLDNTRPGDVRNVESLLFSSTFQFEDLLLNKGHFNKPALINENLYETSQASILMQEQITTHKTLISFCI